MSKNCIILCLFVAIIFASCQRRGTPRPLGYFRIEIPEPAYELFSNSEFPFTFALSKFAEVIPLPNEEDNSLWINIYYPRFSATIHSSYKTINDNLHAISEDTRAFVFRHTVRADAISEQLYENYYNNTSGILYRLEGNAASPVQFALTDSVNFFFRGALFFKATPNRDSIAPVLDFIFNDIIVLMETFEHETNIPRRQAIEALYFND